MKEYSKTWYPVPDINTPFGSILYSYNRGRNLSVKLYGERTLSIDFSMVVAVRFELECPGFDPIPRPLPTLNLLHTFPLLIIENSEWSEQYGPIYGELSHFVLISSDDLVQVLAKPSVLAQWVA